MITEFKSNTRGGLAIVNKGEVMFNNNYSQNFNEQKRISTGIFLDFNALYATVLKSKTTTWWIF